LLQLVIEPSEEHLRLSHDRPALAVCIEQA